MNNWVRIRDMAMACLMLGKQTKIYNMWNPSICPLGKTGP
jgi:hypothetical protein